MKNFRLLAVALLALVFAAPACNPRPTVQKSEAYAYVIVEDVWAQILPGEVMGDSSGIEEHKYKAGEWFINTQLNPEVAHLLYRGFHYAVPKQYFRLLNKSEVKELIAQDRAFAEQANYWLLLNADGESMTGEKAKPVVVSNREPIHIFNLFWLLLPGLLIAGVAYAANSLSKRKGEWDEDERVFVKRSPIILLGLYLLEIALLALLIFLGVFNSKHDPGMGIIFALPGLALLIVNGYSAFAVNSLILSSYNVSFSWKRIIVYGLASVGLGYFATILISVIFKFDPANGNMSSLVISTVLTLILLLTMFAVDMRKQNPASLRKLPILALLFLIGTLLSAVLVMIVVIAVGAYYVWSWQLKSEEAKDRNNDNLSCSNCNSRGLCSSPGVPCSRHQNWQ